MIPVMIPVPHISKNDQTVQILFNTSLKTALWNLQDVLYISLSSVTSTKQQKKVDKFILVIIYDNWAI